MKDSPELTSRYELDTVLSWQGPTRTYRARDPAAGVTVAVKSISLGTVPEAQVLRQRFLATAGVLRTLDHPNLPRLLDFGVTPDGEAFLVFDWIEGTTLDRLGDLAPRQVLPYVLQAIEGLECLALHGLVHLNLSPENLLVTTEGEIKLLGLGGSLFRVDWQSPLALGGAGGGTGIAAPELQATMGAGSALWRADLYALAFVTCALLDAEVDGAGTATPEVRFPQSVAAQLHAPEQLAKALARCLHIEPSQRPVSYSNLAKVLQHSLPRAPRAESVVRDTQVFDVGELAAREARGPVAPVEERPPEPQSEPSTEIVALRSDLEESLAEGELKQPSDLGREAEIYEGFLEIREEGSPVEIDLGGVEAAPPAVAEPAAAPSHETALDPEMPADESRQRHAASPAAPETAETVMTPVAKPPASPASQSPPRSASPPSPPPSEKAPDAPPPAGAGRSLPPLDPAPPALAPQQPQAPAPGKPAQQAPEAGRSVKKPATASPKTDPEPGKAPRPPARPQSPRAPAAQSPVQAPPGRTAPVRSPRPDVPRAPFSAAFAGKKGARPATATGASSARRAASTPARPAAPARSPLLDRLAGAASRVRRRSRRLDRRVVLAAAGVTLVAVSSLAAVLFWPAAPGPKEELPLVAVEAPPVAAPEPPADPAQLAPQPVELPPALEEAVALLDDGKLLEARSRLDEVAQLEEEGALDRATLEAYRAVEEVLLRQRSESLERELSAALRDGSVSALRQTLASVSAAEEELLSETPSGRLALSDARRARTQLDAFDDAVAGGDRMEALNAAFLLAKSFPVFDSALRARERATAAVEAEVDTLIDQGRLEDAEERLVLLKSIWPDRPGIDGKLGTVRSRMESEARFDTVLAAASAAGVRERPHEGLRLLDSVQPKREYVDRFARQRQELARQLAELDAEAPTVRLQSEDLEFRKGEPAIVELAASDDYLVAGLSFWARGHDQDDYTELPARRIEEGLFRVEIAPAFHQDKVLRFWASAHDLSGNEGRLGSPDAPVEIKRKRWFR